MSIRLFCYQGGNPVKGVQMTKVDNQVTEYMTNEELSRLMAVLDKWPSDDSAAFIKFVLPAARKKAGMGVEKGDHPGAPQ